MAATLDFDGDALNLVRSAYTNCEEQQNKLNAQYGRDYLLYHAYVDMSNRDSSLPQIQIPKIYSIVETKAAKEVKALFGSTPWIEFTTSDKNMKPYLDIQNRLRQGYLEDANFYAEAILLEKIANLYGTCFIEPWPERVPVVKKFAVPHPMGGFVVESKVVNQLRFTLKTRGPWEVYVDPFATDLETDRGCRFVITFDVASRRQIAESFGIDPAELANPSSIEAGSKSGHVGYNIRARYGLPAPTTDNDMGVLMCYQSNDRYIWVWDGYHVLEETDNPFAKNKGGHGRINLSRMVHGIDAHTQNRFWGQGEAKPNEILQTMLGDWWSLLFGARAYGLHPAVFFRSPGMDKNDIVLATANRIPVSTTVGRPITDDFYVHPGIPSQHEDFQLIPMIERSMDLTARQFPPSYGEADPGVSTATESVQLSQIGDVNTEQTVKLGEHIFLRDFGLKLSAHIDQFGTAQDYAEIVGQEAAYTLISANPEHLPCRIGMNYKGSNRVANLLVKQRSDVALINVLIPLYQQGLFNHAKQIMEDHEWPQEQIETNLQEGMAMYEQSLMQAQMQAEQQAQQSQVDNAIAVENLRLKANGGKQPVKNNNRLAVEARR